MLPILVDLGFLKIYTFGIFLILAFFWSAFFLWKNILLTSHKEDEVFDALFFALVGAVLIGRIEHVALHFSDFGFNILKFVLINGYPGIGIFGFVLGFFLATAIYVSMHKIEFDKLVDYVVPPFLLALAIAKLGAFFSGAEIGSQTTFFLSLSYPQLDGMRHLTSLYESILYFIGTFLSYKILRAIRRNKLSEGFNFKYLLGYFALVSVLFDSMKSFRPFVKGISFDFGVSVVLLLTVCVYMLYYFRKFIMSSFSRVLSITKQNGKKI